MKPEQIESLGLARNILQRMMRENEEPEPDSERDEGTETPNKGIQFSFSGGAESPLGKVAEDMKSEENDALRVDTALNASIANSLIPDMIEMSETFIGSIWETSLKTLVEEAVSNASGTSATTADNTKLLAKTKKAFADYMSNIDRVLQERAGQQDTLDTAIETRRALHLEKTQTTSSNSRRCLRRFIRSSLNARWMKRQLLPQECTMSMSMRRSVSTPTRS